LAAMDMVFPSPVATTLEMVSAIVSAAVYLAVGIAVLARAPMDVRARTFLAIAIASAAPYSMTLLLWAHGPEAALTRPMLVAIGSSLMIGSLALFHFSQVFPWRRPWIRAHWRWLLAGYVLVPVVCAVAIWAFRDFKSFDMTGLEGGETADVSGGMVQAMVLLLVGVPVLFVLGIVAPFGAVLSLYKTWLTARAASVQRARVTTLWILISQMAGGVLTILIIPLLHLVAPTGPWATMAAVLLFACGLLMPVAFAAGVWRYRVLDLDVGAAP
jgi:hypothetical protein